DSEIKSVVIVFLGILVISLAITIFRYSNFYPLITNNYHNLKVNLNGLTSEIATEWVIKYFFNYALGFFFLFAAFNILDKKRAIIIAIVTLFASTGLASIFAIYQYYFNPALGSFSHWADTGRINSTFVDPNALGAYCVIIFPVLFSFVIFTKRWYFRLVFSLLFILFILMTIFSGSRTALLGIFITLFIFLIYGIVKYIKYLKLTSNKKRILNLSIILPLIFIILISFSAIILNENQIKDSFSESDLFKRTSMSVDTFIFYLKEYGIAEGLKSISNYRYFYWGMAVNMAKDYPVTGVGVGSYIIELPDYLRRFGAGFYQSKGIYQVDYAGNYYLQVLSELGIPGLITILFLFFLIIKKTAIYFNFKRKIGNANTDDRFLFGIFISFAVSLVALIFGPHTNFTSTQLTFWLIIAFLLSYIKISQVNILKTMIIPLKDNSAVSIRNPLFLTGSLKFTIKQKISISLILFLFFSSFTISAFTSLSINSKQNKCDFENNYGFYDYDKFEGKDIRWISIDASLKILKNGSILVVPIQDGYPFNELEHLQPIKPLIAKFYIDNLLVKTVKLEDDSWYNIKLPVPDFTEEWFTLTIVLNRAWVPKELRFNNDTRELGARIGEFKFE
ncbi:MAG: hypothetical protein FJW56_08910, partial [Actinobacteria bacterium]|nr:hypothetical protein [Actinomycetota bacterium]